MVYPSKMTKSQTSVSTKRLCLLDTRTVPGRDDAKEQKSKVYRKVMRDRNGN